jgi:large subunit ribosomal protein L32
MPNPKWRHSKRRKRARRTHYKTEVPQIATCKTTGEPHLFHRAYKVNGDLYYRGQVIVPGKLSGAEAAEA